MKTFLVTATNTTALNVLAIITRIDPRAAIQYPTDSKTVMRIRSNRFSFLTLEAIPGVAHVIFEHCTQEEAMFRKEDA